MPSISDVGFAGVSPPAPGSPVSNGRTMPSISGQLNTGDNPAAIVGAVVVIFFVLGILRVAFELEVKK